MYSVMTCGTCIHEFVATGDPPCNDCRELRSKKTHSHYQKDITGKECETTGKSCDYGICSECNEQ